MSEKDEANLLAIIDSAEKILRFSGEFVDADSLYADERSFDAVLMNFVIIGETVTKLSDKLMEINPQVPWPKIRGLRNMIAHDYFGIDAEEIWEIIQKHLPPLLTDLNAILNKKSG
ncbi:MAG: HepT-like ribonuclease domain-containing protein [Saprospiraceae bacterium]|nr:HepT-like ribonuclease domain-containing protein [Saprospiraceae bacterium]